MPSAPKKFHRLPVELTEKEWAVVSAEAFSREISRAELVRRAIVHFCDCQETKIAEIVKPPRNWRMPRPSFAG